MRMWMIQPQMLCDKHLLGEHGELHKHLPSFNRGVGVHGRFYPVVQMQFKGYRRRHDQLAREMKRRGMNHKSPLPKTNFNYGAYRDMEVDAKISIRDLADRCAKCKERIEKNG